MRYFALLVLLVGCGGAESALAPPPADYSCVNVDMAPGPAFRIEYAPTATYANGILTPITLDTTPRTVNRYLEPHRSSDTVLTTGSHGAAVSIIFAGASKYCVTVFDSLTNHLPNAQRYFVVP